MSIIQREDMPVGNKILNLRKQLGVTQVEIAEAIGVRRDKIGDVENGLDEYTERQLQKIREYFNIVGLPLNTQECVIFYRHLYYLRNYVRTKRLQEARDILNKLLHIDNLEPCDPDMVMLCKMFEIQLLIAEGYYLDAEKKLDLYDPEKMHNENQYHYYYNRGYLSLCNEDYDSGLEYLLKTYELKEVNENLLPEDDERLYYHLAQCYTYLEIPYRAIDFVQKAREVCSEDRIPNYNLYLNRTLARNYINTNQLVKAEKLLEKCIIEYKCTRDNALIGNTLFCFGCLHKKTENWTTAIMYFNDALSYAPEGTITYYAALYNKIYCIIQTRAFPDAKKILNEAKTMCKADLLWKNNFEALHCYLTIYERVSIKNDKECDYIINTAIPHFYENHDYFTAIEYCKLLERHYRKIKSNMNSLLMANEMLKIYERCLINHGGDVN
ncbi:MAG: helix-turn-helix domain-containing protein [Defluviitaleaceae bacterium]|nr:helix-turn-helix domain-containing protein [Defluviitaleaceae bacterium]